MAPRESPTIRYAFDTRITQLATNTTLDTATRHEYSPITVYVPETTSRSFVSAFLEVYVRDAFTVATDIDGVRIGFRFGSNAGSSLTKSGGVDGNFDAGASSQTFAGNGYVEWVVTGSITSGERIVGLSTSDPDQNRTTVGWGWYHGVSSLQVWELGSVKFTTTYAVGDLLKVQRVGSTIYYYKNHKLEYTSATTTSSPLMIDTSVRSSTVPLWHIKLFDNGVEQTITWSNVVNVTAGTNSYYDYDITVSATNSGDHELDRYQYDVTNLFNAYFTGTSSSVTASVAVATGSASNVNNVVCVLNEVHSFDDAGATTLIKCVPITIQSHHTNLNTSHEEIGCLGTTPAPANQIPALDTWLPETSKTYRHAFLDLWANENQGAVTTDFTPYYQIDATAESARATCEAALATNVVWHDVIPYSTSTHSTASAHAFKMRCDLASRLTNMGGILWVTYEYSSSSTSVMATAFVPLGLYADEDRSASEVGTNGPLDASAGDATVGDWMGTTIYVAEPGTITLKQSAIYGIIDGQSNGGDPQYTAGSQTARTYSAGGNTAGQVVVFHRVDHSSGWSLSSGKNRLLFKAWLQSNSVAYRTLIRGFAILNYTCSKPASGAATTSAVRTYHLASHTSGNAAYREVVSGAARAPTVSVSGTAYWLHGAFVEVASRGSAAATQVFAKAQPGELDGGGWMSTHLMPWGGPSERFSRYSWFPTMRWWNRNQHETDRMNLWANRTWRFVDRNQANEFNAALWVSSHNVTYTISGTVSGYTGDGSGITVEVFDPEDIKVGSTTTTAGGTYTFTVNDNRAGYWSQARQSSTRVGRSDDGTPT